MASDCIFCKIADGQIPAYKVWEDEKFLAFLSIHPIKEGHTLVIPKKHLPYVFDIDDSELQELSLAAKKVAKKLEKTFKPKTGKIGMSVYGLDINHSHIHLVPLDKSGDLNMANSRPATQDQLKSTHQKISQTSD